MPPLHSLSPCALSYLLSLFFHTFTSWGYAATGGDKKGRCQWRLARVWTQQQMSSAGSGRGESSETTKIELICVIYMSVCHINIKA